MRIVTYQFSIRGKYLEIFISGCKCVHECRKTCFNSELWNFDLGENYRGCYSEIYNKLTEFDELIDYIVITGGEPLDQNIDELIDFIKYLKQFDKEIILFTSYSFDKVDTKVLELIDYVKTEPYLEEYKKKNKIFIFELASINQKIFRKEGNLWKMMKT